jgi:hypothetical protein
MSKKKSFLPRNFKDWTKFTKQLKTKKKTKFLSRFALPYLVHHSFQLFIPFYENTKTPLRWSRANFQNIMCPTKLENVTVNYSRFQETCHPLVFPLLDSGPRNDTRNKTLRGVIQIFIHGSNKLSTRT